MSMLDYTEYMETSQLLREREAEKQKYLEDNADDIRDDLNEREDL